MDYDFSKNQRLGIFGPLSRSYKSSHLGHTFSKPLVCSLSFRTQKYAQGPLRVKDLIIHKQNRHSNRIFEPQGNLMSDFPMVVNSILIHTLKKVMTKEEKKTFKNLIELWPSHQLCSKARYHSTSNFLQKIIKSTKAVTLKNFTTLKLRTFVRSVLMMISHFTQFFDRYFRRRLPATLHYYPIIK